MTIEQTIDVPENRRVFLEFLAPKEIPAGPARIELKVTPVLEKQTIPESAKEKPTPRADALLGILSHVGEISPEEIREERMAKYLK